MAEKDHEKLVEGTGVFSSAEVARILAEQVGSSPEATDHDRMARLMANIEAARNYLDVQTQMADIKSDAEKRSENVEEARAMLAKAEHELAVWKEAYDRLDRANEMRAILDNASIPAEDRLGVDQMERRDRARYRELIEKAKSFALGPDKPNEGEEQ
jgi:hypothetical protein